MENWKYDTCIRQGRDIESKKLYMYLTRKAKRRGEQSCSRQEELQRNAASGWGLNSWWEQRQEQSKKEKKNDRKESFIDGKGEREREREWKLAKSKIKQKVRTGEITVKAWGKLFHLAHDSDGILTWGSRIMSYLQTYTYPHGLKRTFYLSQHDNVHKETWVWCKRTWVENSPVANQIRASINFW